MTAPTGLYDFRPARFNETEKNVSARGSTEPIGGIAIGKCAANIDGRHDDIEVFEEWRPKVGFRTNQVAQAFCRIRQERNVLRWRHPAFFRAQER